MNGGELWLFLYDKVRDARLVVQPDRQTPRSVEVMDEQRMEVGQESRMGSDV